MFDSKCYHGLGDEITGFCTKPSIQAILCCLCPNNLVDMEKSRGDILTSEIPMDNLATSESLMVGLMCENSPKLSIQSCQRQVLQSETRVL